MNWNDYVVYKNGKLYWVVKPSSRVNIGAESGCLKSYGYRHVKLFGKTHQAHRIVWQLHNGQIPDGLQIDHINGIKDDNRIENLRLATHSQQALNTKLRSDNTNGIKGVYKRSKNQYVVNLAQKRYSVRDFFEACCIRKSWEGKNVFNRQY